MNAAAQIKVHLCVFQCQYLVVDLVIWLGFFGRDSGLQLAACGGVVNLVIDLVIDLVVDLIVNLHLCTCNLNKRVLKVPISERMPAFCGLDFA